MRKAAFLVALGLGMALAASSCSRQEPTPEVTVVFIGGGQPVSYPCDEVIPMGRLSDGRPIYRCSIWSKPAPQR